MINKLYTLLLRRKNTFSLILAISEDPLDKYFWLKIDENVMIYATFY